MKQILKNDRGFTLLELVISLLLSAVVVLIIASVLHLAIRSEEKGTRRQESSQHVRVLIAKLTFLLKGAYPYVAKTDEGREYYFEGGSDEISFITSSVVPETGSLIDRAGLKWVRIYLDSEGLKTMENFFFLSDDYEGGSPVERIIDDTVTEISFEYLDLGEKRTDEGEWKSEWSMEDSEYLPAAIKVSIVVKEEGSNEDVELPPFTVKVQSSRLIK